MSSMYSIPFFLAFHVLADFETKFSLVHMWDGAVLLSDLHLRSLSNSHACKLIQVHLIDAVKMECAEAVPVYV